MNAVPAEGGIAAVVLAAGASRRFGSDNKLLAGLEGRTLVARVVGALLSGGVADFVVVTVCDPPLLSYEVVRRVPKFLPCALYPRA